MLSDRVVVMNQGRIEQIGDPKTVYAEAGHGVRAGLRRPGAAAARRCRAPRYGPRWAWSAADALDGKRNLMLAVRPEAVETAGEGYSNATLKVREIVFLGSKTQVLFESAEDDVLIAGLSGAPPAPAGRSDVAVRWPVDATLALPELMGALVLPGYPCTPTAWSSSYAHHPHHQEPDGDRLAMLESYAQYLATPSGRDNRRDGALATLSSLFCLLIGYPFARLMARSWRWRQALLFAALLTPMALSLMVRAFRWTILLGREGQSFSCSSRWGCRRPAGYFSLRWGSSWAL